MSSLEQKKKKKKKVQLDLDDLEQPAEGQADASAPTEA